MIRNKKASQEKVFLRALLASEDEVLKAIKPPMERVSLFRQEYARPKLGSYTIEEIFNALNSKMDVAFFTIVYKELLYIHIRGNKNKHFRADCRSDWVKSFEKLMDLYYVMYSNNTMGPLRLLRDVIEDSTYKIKPNQVYELLTPYLKSIEKQLAIRDDDYLADMIEYHKKVQTVKKSKIDKKYVPRDKTKYSRTKQSTRY